MAAQSTTIKGFLAEFKARDEGNRKSGRLGRICRRALQYGKNRGTEDGDAGDLWLNYCFPVHCQASVVSAPKVSARYFRLEPVAVRIAHEFRWVDSRVIHSLHPRRLHGSNPLVWPLAGSSDAIVLRGHELFHKAVMNNCETDISARRYRLYLIQADAGVPTVTIRRSRQIRHDAVNITRLGNCILPARAR
jgi:hypothetical protein